MISSEEALLLIDKLASESTPILGYSFAGDGSHAKVKGFLDSAPDGAEATLCLKIGDGRDCVCSFGDNERSQRNCGTI